MSKDELAFRLKNVNPIFFWELIQRKPMGRVKHYMKEKMCPFCLKPVRSDALAKRYCKLCGMFIDNTEPQFIYVTSTGDSPYFCCKRCMNMYMAIFCQGKTENTIVTVEDICEDISVERDGEDICIYYSKFVQEITYLPTVQASEPEM